MRKYSRELIEDFCKESSSYRQVLNKLGIVEAGGNYNTIKNKIKEYGIDISHFTGRGWNIGLKHKLNKEIPLENRLINGEYYSSHKLRLRLFKENYFEKKCYNCGITNWLNKPISFELEHIDGNNLNNCISNLTILCPNCHSQTTTWRRKKKFF